MSLEGVGAASELRTASKSDDMLGEGILCCVVGVVFAMRADEGGVSEIQEGGNASRARRDLPRFTCSTTYISYLGKASFRSMNVAKSELHLGVKFNIGVVFKF
jgi:hypothetical protein